MSVIHSIALYGDSILKGVQLSDGEKYAVENHMGLEQIAQKYSLGFSNKSRFGCTITKGEALLDRGLEKGLDCDCVIMDYGGNDCDFDWRAISEDPDGSHLPNTPLQVFRRTYLRMIEKLRAAGVVPVLTNLPPISGEKYFNWFCRAGLNKENVLRWLGGTETIYRYQENYSREVESIAAEAGTPLIDLRGGFLSHRRIDSLLCADGIHPNTQGQKIIADAFSGFARARLA